jgi:hypothetical protein
MDSKYLILSVFFIISLLKIEIVQSQNYRNANAYVFDFEKNESYVEECLIDYSSTIIYGLKDTRTQATLERIYSKLEAINTNLSKNDIGYLGDISLRDSFLKMNRCTITLLKNNSLRLTDYDYQKTLDFKEIFRNFSIKKQDIINYYSIILDYTNCKRSFCKKNNVTTKRYFTKKNLFEYDAHQSLFFFKLNVLDAKLCDLLLTTDTENVDKCLSYIYQVCNEILVETEKYKKINVDHSLNNANIRLIEFLINQNENLIPLYKEYILTLNEFRVVKSKNDIPVEFYNEKVRFLNKTKNKFYSNFNSYQAEKKELIENWYQIKSDFLKNNL